MKNGRNQVDVLSLERTLGLKSERGISRQHNKESPPIDAALRVIKDIQVRFVDQELDQIRSSQALKDEASSLFDTYGKLLKSGKLSVGVRQAVPMDALPFPRGEGFCWRHFLCRAY